MLDHFRTSLLHIVTQVLSSIDDIDAILKSRMVQESVNKLYSANKQVKPLQNDQFCIKGTCVA